MKKRMMATMILCAMTVCAPTSSNANNNVKQTAHAEKNQQAIEKEKGLWIDVRSAQEYQAGHLADSVNVVHSEIADKIATLAPDKNAPIHLYCHSGRRAEVALQELKKLGYTNVQNHGGYENLRKMGLK